MKFKNWVKIPENLVNFVKISEKIIRDWKQQ